MDDRERIIGILSDALRRIRDGESDAPALTAGVALVDAEAVVASAR